MSDCEDAKRITLDLLRGAESWEADTRLIGNVQAQEIGYLCKWVLNKLKVEEKKPEKPEKLVCVLHGWMKWTCELCEKDAQIDSLREGLGGLVAATIEALRKVEHCERQRGPLPQLDQTGGVGELDVADCAVTVEECRGVIRRMEKRREKDLETIAVLRKALAGLVGGEDEEELDRIEIQLMMGDSIWLNGPTALAAVAALRKVGKHV